MKVAVPFEDRLIPVPEVGCYLFDGAWTGEGYGAVKRAGKMVGAHRISWERENGPIPAGAVVCHHCDTPACCNPDHLFLGTQKANMADKYRKGRGRHTRGEDHGPTRLTEKQVLAIKADSRGRKDVAREYGVSPGCIDDIRSGRNWGWLK